MTKVMRECKTHGQEVHVLKTDGKYRCRKCASDNTRRARRRAKLKAINYKGGHCNRCGESYLEYPEVFEFHHIDPSKKDFSIGESQASKAWARLQTELDKCILLCSNCHRMHHADIRKGSIAANALS